MPHRILIIDSHRDIRQLLQYTFELNGYIVDTASTGTEAFVPLTQDVLPSLIIVGDLTPRPDASLALVNDIKVAFIGLNLPVVMVSTSVRTDDILCGLAHGADRYVTKPFAPSKLVALVRELLIEPTPA